MAFYDKIKIIGGHLLWKEKRNLQSKTNNEVKFKKIRSKCCKMEAVNIN